VVSDGIKISSTESTCSGGRRVDGVQDSRFPRSNLRCAIGHESEEEKEPCVRCDFSKFIKQVSLYGENEHGIRFEHADKGK